MISEELLSLVAERCGADPVNASYYTKIREWESWWKGYSRPFHEFTENGAGGSPIRRQLYRMNMAKKICEDWASLLLNDGVRIGVGDEAGSAFVRDALEATDFIGEANKLIEKAFAVGTGAAILRIDGREAADGTFDPSSSSVSFDWVDAAHIIPISVKGGRITEAAFVSEGMLRGKEYVYLETHMLGDDGYVIRNDFFIRENGKMKLSEDTEFCTGEIRTMSRVPLFAILTPNIQNNIDGSTGLGISVYADAIDCLKGVDLAFNNFCRDIKLGGKKVFINQTLVSRDEYGNVFTPDDVAQQLFVTLGDTDFSDRAMITEHNPELRAAENAQAVQCQLNYLSFRCGLGTHHYIFETADGRTKLTATQYMGERQDMRQNAAKHQKNVTLFIKDAVRALLWAASDVFGIDVDKNAPISVRFDDSYFSDSESERTRDLAELNAGVITLDEYRAKWIGGGTDG